MSTGQETALQTPRRTAAETNLINRYVYLDEGGLAPTIDVTETFWQDVFSGKLKDGPGVESFKRGKGWLVALYDITYDMQNWEMHPQGCELLYVITGGLEVQILHDDGSKEIYPLKPGEGCVVPPATWHREVMHERSLLLGITYGKGTRHKPL